VSPVGAYGVRGLRPLIHVRAQANAGACVGGGSGRFTYSRVVENADVASRLRILPVGLSEDCELLADVKVDHRITYDDVRLPSGRLADRLRIEQAQRFR
jgi:predicted homoserine dehydrogenase-like protein